MHTLIGRSASFLFLLLLALVLAGCWSRPADPVAEIPENGPARPEFPDDFYAGKSAEEGVVYHIASEQSEARFFLWRGGPLADRGHNHVMRITKMKGAIFLPKNLLENEGRFDVVFQAEDIEVDPLPLRQEIGGAFSGTGMTKKGAEGTREHMLGEKVLNAARFPAIGLHSSTIVGELPKLAVETKIILHGFARQQYIPITVRVDGTTLKMEGAFVIEQTDFGIKPFTAMGGALFIRDPIMIEFELIARSR